MCVVFVIGYLRRKILLNKNRCEFFFRRLPRQYAPRKWNNSWFNSTCHHAQYLSPNYIVCDLVEWDNRIYFDPRDSSQHRQEIWIIWIILEEIYFDANEDHGVRYDVIPSELESEVAEKTIEDRVLSLEIENAEMRDRLTELGEQIKSTPNDMELGGKVRKGL